MSGLAQEHDSLEYVKVKVSATVSGAAYDPTGDTVQMAFTQDYADPEPADWQSADWETISGSYYARCLVGPGGTIELATESGGSSRRYKVWVKVTDNPEIPVKAAGILTIF